MYVTRRHRTLMLLGPALLSLLVAACSDDDKKSTDLGPARDTVLGEGASVDRPPSGDRGASDTSTTTADWPALPDYGSVKECSAIGLTECLSNLDCAANRRCQNLATELDPVPCCVVGPRGTKTAGQTCSGQTDCESGICVNKDGPYSCSKPCTTADDCPTGMKVCVLIANMGSVTQYPKWCFPEQ